MVKYLSLLLLFGVGCSSTKPTPYQKMQKNEGYEEKTLDDLRVVVFKGNAYSKKPQVNLYAEFRAIEVCREAGFKYANIMDFEDKTTSRDVVRTSTNAFGPSYYYGMSPFYSRYSSFGMSMGIGNMQSNSWKETYIYPNLEVIFRCANSVLRTRAIFREVPSEEMKHLVKDLKGGLQIEKFSDGAAEASNLKKGDIILKVGAERVEKIHQFVALFTPEHRTRSVAILREGYKTTVKVTATDVSEEIEKLEAEVVARACAKKEISTRPICKKDKKEKS